MKKQEKIATRAIITASLLTLITGCSHMEKIHMPEENKPILSTKLDIHQPTSIIVPVTISGKKYQFLLDTGASYTFIDNKLAKTLTQTTPESKIPVTFHRMLSDGLVTTSEKRLHKADLTLWQPLAITLGNHTVPGSDPWIGIDISLFNQSIGQDLDGILGIDTFRQLNWEINNLNHTLTVWRHAPSILNYQQCEPYSDSYGRSPAIQVSNVVFNIDTGADYSYVSQEFIEYLKKEHKDKISEGINVKYASASGLDSSKEYLIDGFYLQQLPVGRLRIGENKNDLYNLGMNFFSRFDDYLFIPNKMLLCFNAKNFTRYDSPLLRTIAIRYFNNKVEIFYNDPKYIEKFGLKNGDIVLEVNGQQALPKDITYLRNQLSETPSGKLTIKIERNNIQKIITI
ncbi:MULTISPECIES: aspartyl protease family protein [Photorhabdus]|uniref:Retroviral aspartyl protease n=2 Tax=Photorhabdus TaxID=29487 RepID=A0ABX0B6M9_9GAMM|nr:MULTISPECIES: aspartyl protease family protein [Photorhabdus]MCC8374822.1 aspartyl protease family protein [Photorhabdus bodei]MCC8466111.1 aspartyl protease family protein [Photorhabdus bodei]MCT8352826.1 aspartyl protease family protein [Photorhabdus kayaii]MDB6369639.1 aspartyl protease family protein [Photorhabdus bodei]MDB6373897.1 aspartyl protease family protein [Photorhabdus bodei]